MMKELSDHLSLVLSIVIKEKIRENLDLEIPEEYRENLNQELGKIFQMEEKVNANLES